MDMRDNHKSGVLQFDAEILSSSFDFFFYNLILWYNVGYWKMSFFVHNTIIIATTNTYKFNLKIQMTCINLGYLTKLSPLKTPGKNAVEGGDFVSG